MRRSLGPELLLPLLLAFPLFFWGSTAPFQDPDEGMHASVARAMVERGDWLTPRFDGLRLVEKPPLYFWLTALTYGLFGFSEWGARLWPNLGAVAMVLCTAVLGRETRGRRTGLVAGLICATTLGVFLQTRNLGIEPLFTAFLSLALAGFVRWIRAGGTAPRLVFYLALALATLTKGSLALVLFACVLGGYFVIERGRSSVGDLGLAWGVPLVLILTLPWYLAVSLANPGFLAYHFGESHLVRFLRGTGAIEDERPLSTPAFLLVSLVWFLPWSFFLPSAVAVVVRRWRSLPAPERSVWTAIGLWVVTVFGLFALSSFKLEHYALPAFPGLAVIVASLWFGEHPRRRLGVSASVGCAAALLGIGAIAVGRWLAPAQPLRVLASFANYYRTLLDAGYPLPLPPVDVFLWFCVSALACLSLGFAAAVIALRRNAERAALAGLLAGTTAFLITVGALIGEIAPYESMKGVATAIERLASPGDLILYEGYLEHAGGLPFYTGRQIQLLGAPRGDLWFGSQFPEARGLFHSPDELGEIWRGARRVFLVTDLPPELSHVRTLAPESRHLLFLDHGKRLYSNRPERDRGP